MDNKTKNMKLMKYLNIFCISLAIVIGISTFYKFSEGYFREWIMMMVSLIGTLLAGILTMAGVILTLNRAIDDNHAVNLKDKESKKESIKRKARVLYFDLAQYGESIAKLHKGCIQIRAAQIEKCDNDYQEEINKAVRLRNIIFLSNNSKEIFYDIVVEKKFDDKMIECFCNVYNSQKFLQSIYKDNIYSNISLILQESSNIISGEINECRDEIFILASKDTWNWNKNEMPIPESYERIRDKEYYDYYDNDFKELLRCLEEI